MASIECAIELYDGVSPVLEAMTGTLDEFISRFEGLEAGLVPEIQMDVAGLLEAAAALEALKTAGAVTAEELAVQFAGATGEIGMGFLSMQAQVTAVLIGLEDTAAGVANRLPGYFSGPLANIAAQFQAMAASARNSLASITAAASAAMSSAQSAAATITASASQAVSAVSDMQAVTTLSIEAARLEAPVQEVVVTTAETVEPELATLTQSVTLLPQSLQGESLYAAPLNGDLGTFMQERMPALAGDDWGEPAFEGAFSLNEGAPERGSGDAVFHVQVSNENHIGSEMDMEAFFRAFEDRLMEALQSSAEGVY